MRWVYITSTLNRALLYWTLVIEFKDNTDDYRQDPLHAGKCIMQFRHCHGVQEEPACHSPSAPPIFHSTSPICQPIGGCGCPQEMLVDCEAETIPKNFKVRHRAKLPPCMHYSKTYHPPMGNAWPCLKASKHPLRKVSPWNLVSSSLRAVQNY